MQKSSLKTACFWVTSCSACRISCEADDQVWQTGDIPMDLILFWYNTTEKTSHKKNLLFLSRIPLEFLISVRVYYFLSLGPLVNILYNRKSQWLTSCLKTVYGVQWFGQGRKFFCSLGRGLIFKQSSTKIRTHGYMLYKAQVTCCTLFPNTRGELLTCHVLKMKREFADYKNVEQWDTSNSFSWRLLNLQRKSTFFYSYRRPDWLCKSGGRIKARHFHGWVYYLHIKLHENP